MQIDIQPVEWPGLPEQLPPDLSEEGLLHGRAPAGDRLHIIMHQPALLEVARHGGSDTATELGGLLIGRVYQYEGRPYVEIEAALPVHSDRHGPVHFTFTADAWAQAHRERETRYPDLHIVGWFHTHPDLGVFFSTDDEIVQSTAFTMPWQVGLVIDPIRREGYFFGWLTSPGEGNPAGKIGPLDGFYELGGENPGSVIDWRVVHNTGLAALWRDGYAVYRSAADQVAGPTIYSAEWRDLAIRQAMWVSGLTLLAAALLFLLVLLPIRGRTRDLEQVAAGLVEKERQALHESGAIDCPSPAVVIWEPHPGQRFAVGETISIVGTAAEADAARYLLEMRPVPGGAVASTGGWQEIGGRRRDVTVGQIARWRTAGLAPGRYELRLLAVQAGNAPLFQSACRVPVTLDPAPAAANEPLPTAAVTAVPLPSEQPAASGPLNGEPTPTIRQDR